MAWMAMTLFYDTAQKALFIDGDANGSQEAMKLPSLPMKVVLSHQNLARSKKISNDIDFRVI